MAHNGPESAERLATQRNRLKSYAKEQSFEIVGTSCETENGLTMDRPGLLGIHAADCGEIDLSLDTILRGMFGNMEKRPQVGA